MLLQFYHFNNLGSIPVFFILFLGEFYFVYYFSAARYTLWSEWMLLEQMLLEQMLLEQMLLEQMLLEQMLLEQMLLNKYC